MARDLHAHGRRFLAAAKKRTFERSLGTAKARTLPRVAQRYIRGVEPASVKSTVCIVVDSPARMLLAGEHLIPVRSAGPVGGGPHRVCAFAIGGWGSSRPRLTLLLHPHRITKRAPVPGHRVRPPSPDGSTSSPAPTPTEAAIGRVVHHSVILEFDPATAREWADAFRRR